MHLHIQRVKMLHLDKKWINSFGWDKSFCVEKKENGGNGLTLATIATKLHRPKNEKKNWNYVGKWFVNEAGVWIIIHLINYKFFGQLRRSILSHYPLD